MVDGVMAGLSAFSGLVGMARGLKDINDAVVRNEAILELTGRLLDAQQDYATQIQKVNELEAKLAKFEDWESKKQRYELKEHGPNGVRAYALKDGVDPPEIPHSICPDCYEKRERSILQHLHVTVGRREILQCQKCGWIAHIKGHPEYAPGERPTRR